MVPLHEPFRGTDGRNNHAALVAGLYLLHRTKNSSAPGSGDLDDRCDGEFGSRAAAIYAIFLHDGGGDVAVIPIEGTMSRRRRVAWAGGHGNDPGDAAERAQRQSGGIENQYAGRHSGQYRYASRRGEGFSQLIVGYGMAIMASAGHLPVAIGATVMMRIRRWPIRQYWRADGACGSERGAGKGGSEGEDLSR